MNDLPKWLPFFILTSILLFTGCDYKEQEKKLEEKEAALNRQQQELLLKEKELQLKEEALAERESKIKALPEPDTTSTVNEELTGNWAVRMVCTETSCPGSAVGDTKTETWQISYEGDTYLAKAMSGDKLVRIYSGLYTGNTLELIEDRESTSAQPATKMIVRLRMTDQNSMAGQREIIRENNCKIMYQLQLIKQ